MRLKAVHIKGLWKYCGYVGIISTDVVGWLMARHGVFSGLYIAGLRAGIGHSVRGSWYV